MSIKKLIKIAENEIGYLEKASNKDLDSKTKNAGKGNYTKYWRDLKPNYQGEPWCQAFVNWVFWKVYGMENSLKLLCCNSFDYYTPTCASFFKQKKQWFTQPKVGDIVYFKNSTRIHHVGIVVVVSPDTITTVEGNTTHSSKQDTQVVANGGGVWSRVYSRNNESIAGYGRPNYSSITSSFVIRMYEKVLAREPEPTGYAWWSGNLATGIATGASIARGFYLGEEYTARRRTNKEFITDLYIGLLGRTPSVSERGYWVKEAKKKGREEVVKGFVESAEFAQSAFKYGFDVGAM